MSVFKWNLADLPKIKKNGFKVMSTFCCGGGSTMGYKLAGFDVIAANDIDPVMARHYKNNHNPKHFFLNPIGELLTCDLPEELFELDILDGSPPCSTFSMAGNREKDWGKEKHFKEGQAKQVLSDLFFDYLALVGRLKPKVAIAENVKGMILGNAKGYTKLVMQEFRNMGYTPQLFLVDGVACGVPQRRQRVFFCAIRDDLFYKPLKLNPSHPVVTAGEACADLQELTEKEKAETRPDPNDLKCWPFTKKGDSYAAFVMKNENRVSGFNVIRISENKPSPTLTSKEFSLQHWDQCRRLTLREYARLGSFPEDYQFESFKIGKYVIGMSVPPLMTKEVALAVLNQWLK